MNRNTKSIVLVCLGLVLLLLITLLVIFFVNKNEDKNVEESNSSTTITTTTKKSDLVLEKNGVELTISDSEFDNVKLHVNSVDVALKDVNVLAVYDITLKDENGNEIKVKDANLNVAIPYENKDNYSSEILFKDATNLNLLTFNEYGRPIVIDNVNMLEVYEYTNNIGEKSYSYSSPYKLEDNSDLYYRVTNNFETYEFDIEKVIIYTFFKDDRVLTESEQAEFTKFETLIEEGKVEIIDISDSIYETE